jgi:hypothetical protein
MGYLLLVLVTRGQGSHAKASKEKRNVHVMLTWTKCITDI